MSFGDRLGLAGVILSLVALAAPYLWPDKKWIGWISLSCAVVLLVAWGWLEIEAELPRLRSQYPVRSIIVIFIVGGCLAVALWTLIQPASKESSQTALLSPAGFIRFVGPVIDGYAPMMQENQTEAPLDDVRLTILAIVPKGSAPTNDDEWGTGDLIWQKEIDIGTCRARLTTGLSERFPIGGRKLLWFSIFMMTRFQSYRETIKLTKTSDKEYSAELNFYGGVEKPIFTREMKLPIMSLKNRQPIVTKQP